MTLRIPVQPRLLRWAADRRGLGDEALRHKFGRLDAWLAGETEPTLKQLEAFARATHTPIGTFFLQTPPEIELPIPDFRTMGGTHPGQPSPDLLDTIFLCQQRQAWFARYARSIGEPAVDFVGSATPDSGVQATAATIRARLGMDLTDRRGMRTWEEALRSMIAQADAAGVLVMVNGVAGGNSHRKLDTEEFRGFALSDPQAPLVFVNGADTKSAQMFTLAHELAHVWLGQSSLSDATARSTTRHRVERWCNRVAAEVLVPAEAFLEAYDRAAEVVGADGGSGEMQRLARLFKVSTLVILRRMYDARGLTREAFEAFYGAEVQRLIALMRRQREGGGGNYYATAKARLSERLTKAVIRSTLEGRSTYTEAFALLGCKKTSTFAKLGRTVGIPMGDLVDAPREGG